jgi:glycine/D-amino acid oxidase-like deaminating enzyme
MTGKSRAIGGGNETGGRTRCDVAVIGGGIIGAATAYFLVRQPAFDGHVVVLEQDPTYARAATALSASSIRQQFSAAVNVRCSQFGIEFLRGAADELAVEDTHGERSCVDMGLVERTYLYLATDAGRALLTDHVARQRALGVAVELDAPDAIGWQW